jgi:hypothetical protein
VRDDQARPARPTEARGLRRIVRISQGLQRPTPCAEGSTATHSFDSSVIAGLHPAIQRILDAKAGHDILSPLDAFAH